MTAHRPSASELETAKLETTAAQRVAFNYHPEKGTAFLPPTHWEINALLRDFDRLIAERDAAFASGKLAGEEAEREACAKIAESDVVRECPFDKHNDLEPTDPCPVCRMLGTDNAPDKCVGSARNRIALAIRSRSDHSTKEHGK